MAILDELKKLETLLIIEKGDVDKGDFSISLGAGKKKYVSIDETATMLVLRETDHFYAGIIIPKKFEADFKQYSWGSNTRNSRINAVSCNKELANKMNIPDTVYNYSYNYVSYLRNRNNFPQYDNNGVRYVSDHKGATFDDRNTEYVPVAKNNADTKSHRKTCVLKRDNYGIIIMLTLDINIFGYSIIKKEYFK